MLPCSPRNVLIVGALVTLLAPHCDAQAQAAPHADPLAPSEVFELFATDNPRIRIRVEQGNLPLAIRKPFYNPETGSLEISIENVGDRLISAWTVEAHSPAPPGVPSMTMRLTNDAFKVLEGVAVPRAPDQVGIPPGASREVSIEILPKSRRATLEEVIVRIRVAVVVFVDTEYVGSPMLAERIFRRRNEKLQAARRLLELAEPALADAATPQLAFTALDWLLDNGPREGRDATLVDTGLRQNLENALRRVRKGPSDAIELLRLQVESLRALREATKRHVPSAFLGRQEMSPAPTLRSNCSVGASAAINTSGCPEPARTESWVATCSPSGDQREGSLSGTGACQVQPQQLSCYPEPRGDGSTTTSSPWHREIQSKGINASHQCIAVGDPATLDFDCNCPPPPPPPPPPGGGGGTDPLSDAPCPDCASPILIDLARDGFQLAGIEDAVSFDIDADGLISDN